MYTAVQVSFPDAFSFLFTQARHTSGKIHFDLISDWLAQLPQPNYHFCE